MRTRTTHPFLRTCNARVCYGVVQCLPVKSPTIYRRNLRGEKNDRLVSVHISIDSGDVFGEKISASPGSSKEIAGLLRKMMIMMMMMMMMMMMKMTRKS